MNNQVCKSCSSSKFIYDPEIELKVCHDCGLVLEESLYLNSIEIEERETDDLETEKHDKNESTTFIKSDILSKYKRTRYANVISTMQKQFQTTNEENRYINELLNIYLNDERKIYENLFMEVGISLFYLVRLYLKGETLIHYCSLFQCNYRKCLMIYNRMKSIFGSKVSKDQPDSFTILLDKLMITCYPNLIQHNDWYHIMKPKNKQQQQQKKKELLKMNEDDILTLDWTLEDQINIKKNTMKMISLYRKHGSFDGKLMGPTLVLCLAINVLHYKLKHQKIASSITIKCLSFDHLYQYTQNSIATTKLRYTELMSQLTYFGKSLPWVKPHLKRDIDIIYYLDDILSSIETLEGLSSSSSPPPPPPPTTTTSLLSPSSSSSLTSKRRYQLIEESDNNSNSNKNKNQIYPLSSSYSNPKDISSKSLPSISKLDPISFQKAEQLRKKRKLQIEKIKHPFSSIKDDHDQDDREDNKYDELVLEKIDQLLKSHQWDQVSIINMTDKEIFYQNRQLTSQYPPHFPDGLDQELIEDDLSKEEYDAYIIP